MTEDEIARLLVACHDSASPDLYLAVVLSITTGARQGEILGLRWADLDLKAGTMVIRADNETTTKGGARNLPIIPEALTCFSSAGNSRRPARWRRCGRRGWCSRRA